MADAFLSVDEGAVPAPGLEPEAAAPEATEPTGSTLNLTGEDVPELLDRQIGDRLVLVVNDITEDGKYILSIAEESVPVEETEADLGGAAPLEGQDAVLSELGA